MNQPKLKLPPFWVLIIVPQIVIFLDYQLTGRLHRPLGAILILVALDVVLFAGTYAVLAWRKRSIL